MEQLFTLDKRLRHKRYQGREGNDLSSNEHKRIHEWDPAYLVQSAAEEENNCAFEGKNLSLKKSLAASHSMSSSLDYLIRISHSRHDFHG